MKRIAAIIFLIILMAPVCGTYLFIYLKKINLKKEVATIIQGRLNENDVVVLRFTDEEKNTVLGWKHEGEFEYAGHMYDIVEQGREGDSIWYKCYRDHKETRLNLEKKKLIARALGQDPFQKKQNERIKNLFNSLFLQHYIASIHFISSTSSIHYSLLITHYSLIFISPPSPPPKSSC